MFKTFTALLLLGCFLISMTGCTLIWGTEREHKFAEKVAANEETFDDGMVISNRHAAKHFAIMLNDFRSMHKFWDRYFMNYDWDDPYID